MITRKHIENLVREELKTLKEEKKVQKEALGTSETDRLLNLIHQELVNLVASMDDVDTSIDQLSAGFYGVLPGEVEVMQKAMGRLAPLKAKTVTRDPGEE